MTKPYGNTGNLIVSSLEEKRDGIVIRFQDGEALEIDVSSYLNGPHLYPGKELSQSEKAALRSLSYGLEAYNYLLRLLSSGKLYSKKALKDKLTSVKKLTPEDAEKLISRAYKQGMMNDDAYVSAYVSSAADKGYSKQKIHDDLLYSGYKEERIQKALEKIDFGLVENEVCERFFTHTSGRNLATLKANIAVKLVKYGYGAGEAEQMIKEYLAENASCREAQKEKEKARLRDEFVRLYAALKKTGLEEDELKDRLIKRLLSRRYDISDILNMWKETV